MGHLLHFAFLKRMREIFTLIFVGFLLVLPIFAPATTFAPDWAPTRELVELAAADPELSTEKTPVETTKAVKITRSTISTASATTRAASQNNSITVAGRTVSTFWTSNENFVHDAGNRAARYGKLIFAHNTDALFGNIRYMKSGQEFTVTTNGTTQRYRVTKVVGPVAREKISMSYMYTATDSTDYACRNGKCANTTHDLVLMTCSGRLPLDENHEDYERTLVFADAISS